MRIHGFPSGELVTSLGEVAARVYQLAFHREGRLVAAVGDGSARVWRVAGWAMEARLAHPSYVYTAQFHPASSTTLATGGCDRVVRVWAYGAGGGGGGGGRGGGGGGWAVLQELPGHTSLIHTLAFDLPGHLLFTGDAGGLVRMWEGGEGPPGDLQSSTESYVALRGAWAHRREYRVEGAVTSLAPHPGGRRLLVHTTHPAHPLRMIDLRSGSVMQTYPEVESFRPPAPSTISPCGSWVVAGSAAGLAMAWDTDTGQVAHLWREVAYTAPITSLAFHPLEHAVIVASGEEHSKARLFLFDRAAAREEEGEAVEEGRREEGVGYPRAEVARLISEGGEGGREEAGTPVDLQDIVEKLNAALVDCRKKNNLTTFDSSLGQGDF